MKSILLVEDDSFLSNIYAIKLKEAGFDVDIAVDGEDALRRLKSKKPEVLLLDIVLPNIDGWEVLRKIKKEESLNGLKIVVLSNLGQKEEAEKGFLLGASKYLIKAHYTPSEVVKEVEEMLK